MTHRTDGELQAYLDAELTREQAAEVAEHLLVCLECRARLGELRSAHESLRAALTELDGAPSRGAGVRTGSAEMRRRALGARRALTRAAALILLTAGAAAAVLPGSPVRALLDQWIRPEAPPSAPVHVDPTVATPTARQPGIASVTVAPVDGRVDVDIRGFAPGTTVRVGFGRAPDVRARLAPGGTEARFSVGPGRLEVLGSPDTGPGEVRVELPTGLRGATVTLDGAEALSLTPAGFVRPGNPDGATREDVVLRVEG